MTQDSSTAPAPPPAEPPRARSPLQTVDRALQVLLSFSERRTDWGVSELAEEFDLDKSTAQRLLAALAVRGFLHAEPLTRRYSLGPAMWRMAAMWERTGGLAALVQPLLLDLAHRTDHTAVFAVPDGFHVRCIAAVDGGNGPLRSQPLVGDLYPAHAGATAKVFFAFLPRGERRTLLVDRPFARFTDNTEVRHAELEASFEQIAADGYSCSSGEYDVGTVALAVPVMLGRRPVGSLTIADSTSVIDGAGIREHLPTLLAARDDLADLLSTRPPSAPQRSWRQRGG